MSPPPQPLYRPTLHQIRVFDRDQVTGQDLLAVVRAAVEHVSSALAPADADILRSQVAPSRALTLPPRVARYPIVRSPALCDVPGHTPLKAALLAYQEGTSLLVHGIWHWDGLGDEATVRQLLTRRWPTLAKPQPNDRGESLLVTAVAVDDKACDAALGPALMAHLIPPQAAPIPVRSLRLHGATLYVPEWLLPQQTPWPALLLFHDRDTEASPAADRLATVDWPLLALYHLRLEHYAQDYQARIAPPLAQRLETMRATLSAVFAPPGHPAPPPPPVLTTSNPQHLQGALVRLAQPQYALLDTLGVAESAQHHVRRELDNLRQRLAQFPLLAAPDALPPGVTVALLQEVLAGQDEQELRQIEADVAQVQYEAVQRTARAIEVLRTRNDILNTLYDKQRNWLIALVGIALALGQVLDRDVAKELYTHWGLGQVWRFLGGAAVELSPNADEALLLSIRLVSIIVLTVGIAACLGLGGWLLRRWKARGR